MRDGSGDKTGEATQALPKKNRQHEVPPNLLEDSPPKRI